MIKWLAGKKSYIVAVLLALVALVEFMAKGDFSFAAIATLFKTEVVATAIATIRAAIAKGIDA